MSHALEVSRLWLIKLMIFGGLAGGFYCFLALQLIAGHK
jgi:hypothetical protein